MSSKINIPRNEKRKEEGSSLSKKSGSLLVNILFIITNESETLFALKNIQAKQQRIKVTII